MTEPGLNRAWNMQSAKSRKCLVLLGADLPDESKLNQSGLGSRARDARLWVGFGQMCPLARLSESAHVGAEPIEWLQVDMGLINPSSEDTAHWRAAGQKLMHCLDQLPHAQRVVFLMHHEDDCALTEIATSLHVAAETVKSRMRYAMTKLRACMGAYLDGMRAGGELA